MASYPALDLRFAAGPGAGTLQDMLYAELDAFEPVAIHECESGDGWRVFFRTPAQRDGARRALAAEFGNALDLGAVDVDDEDWARRSQAALRAIRAGRMVVAPPWDVPPDSRGSRFAIRASQNQESQSDNSTGEPRTLNRDSQDEIDPNRELRSANRDAIVVVIDPSTGFGTGHHATTRLCLELLQEIDLAGRRVIDVGTGSGVLAIAAAKLGAREVVAIDHDQDALQNARDNVQRNNVSIDVVEAELSALTLAPADVVLANLTGPVLQRFAQTLKALVAPAGVLIVSGFGPEDVGHVAAAVNGSVAMRLQDGGWAAVRIAFHAEADDEVTSQEESR